HIRPGDLKHVIGLISAGVGDAVGVGGRADDVGAAEVIRTGIHSGGGGVIHVVVEDQVVISLGERPRAGMLVVRPGRAAARTADKREARPGVIMNVLPVGKRERSLPVGYVDAKNALSLNRPSQLQGAGDYQ